MLSRTADHLYWMARYTERAENLARLLDVTRQMSLVPQSAEAERRQWMAILVLNSLEGGYFARHDSVSAEDVLHFMVRDASNPASLYASLHAARENARAVRSHLTAETWETVNTTWLEIKDKSFTDLQSGGVGEFFDWVKTRSAQTRGVTFGTMLQDEALHFIRLGGLLERADNTARLLDVKFNVLNEEESAAAQAQLSASGGGNGGNGNGAGSVGTGGATDYYHWGALLRSLSAFEVYRKVYRDVITPARVAELLILRADMPRSLRSCLEGVKKMLGLLANDHSAETLRRAGMLNAQLTYDRIEDILGAGLHDYLSDFMDRIYTLGNLISQDFLVAAD